MAKGALADPPPGEINWRSWRRRFRRPALSVKLPAKEIIRLRLEADVLDTEALARHLAQGFGGLLSEIDKAAGNPARLSATRHPRRRQIRAVTPSRFLRGWLRWSVPSTRPATGRGRQCGCLDVFENRAGQAQARDQDRNDLDGRRVSRGPDTRRTSPSPSVRLKRVAGLETV